MEIQPEGYRDGKDRVGALGGKRGNRDRTERKLPPTGWTWQVSVEEEKWAALAPVVIPASFGLMNGVWFKVKGGLLVRDRAGAPVVFAVCEPATRYSQAMTRADRMPALLGAGI